jgi:putative ABC transport system permease protein
MPDWKAEIRACLAALELDPAREAAIVEELAGHAADRYEELLREGAANAEAHRRTLEELCNAKLPTGLDAAETNPKVLLSRRFPFAARILVKYWKLTAVAVVSLAVGIAASVAGLSVLNALLMRPLAASEPSRLVTLYDSSPSQPMQQVSFAGYKFFRENNQTFAGLAAFNYGFNLLPFSYAGASERITVSTVSENYFDVLGIHPAAGRFFVGDDSRPKAEFVLSYPFWQRLGADPAIAGKTIRVNGQPATIVGVAAKDFTGTLAGFAIDAWAPIRIDEALAVDTRHAAQARTGLENRSNRWLTPIGRLKPGLESSRAQADIGTLAERLAHDFPDVEKDHSIGMVPASILPAGGQAVARMFSWSVAGIVFLVLLAACGNVINLLLGLATARRQEMLIRAALGATRGRLFRQLLQESAWLCLASSVLGFFLAYAALQRLFALHPVLINGIPPLVLDFRPDLRVVALAITVITLVTVAVGTVPALYASLPNLAAALNGETCAGGTHKRRARAILVIMQTAVCTVVLVGAGLCLRSLLQLKNVPLGFSGRNLIEVVAGVTEQADQEKPDVVIRQEMAALPGVTDVTLASSLPLGGQGFDRHRVAAEGEENHKESWSEVPYSLVEGNYFSMLGIPLLSGRTFTSADREHSPEVVIVNQTLARKYWPGQDPLGKRLRFADDKGLAEVIGMVADSKYTDLDEPQLAFMFLAAKQHPRPLGDMVLIASTNGNPRLWAESLHTLVRRHDPYAFCVTMTLADQIDFSLLVPRVIFGCVSGFGFLALILSMTGIYATTSYSVSERRKEIGIRIALGAQPRQLMISLLRQSALVTGAGLVVGLALGLASSAALASLLYGIRPVELPVLLGVAALTMAMAFATVYLAARPWVTADPLEAVRHA